MTVPTDQGATAVEYALLIAGIGAAIIVTVSTLGGLVTDLFVADWPW